MYRLLHYYWRLYSNEMTGLSMEIDSLGQRYLGDVADTYDEGRTSSKKWLAEQKAVERLLGTLRKGSTVVDVPVGTGRFIPTFAELGMSGAGVDLSDDMLRHAGTKNTLHGDPLNLCKGSIFSLPFADNSFDCVLSVRFMNWLSATDVCVAFTEMARVSNGSLIAGIRTYASFTNISPFSRRFAGQMRRRLVPPDQLTIHSNRTIANVFARLGLQVSESICVEQRRDGTDYVFYRLDKR